MNNLNNLISLLNAKKRMHSDTEIFRWGSRPEEFCTCKVLILLFILSIPLLQTYAFILFQLILILNKHLCVSGFETFLNSYDLFFQIYDPIHTYISREANHMHCFKNLCAVGMPFGSILY
jgi:hypothetical protein